MLETIIVAALTALVTQSAAALWISRRENQARQRKQFSEALAAVIAYGELPYMIRRRRADTPEAERVRIAEEIRTIQERLAFNHAWLRSESGVVADAYDNLVSTMKDMAGSEMHKAWKLPATESDGQMNIADIDLSALEPLKSDYLKAVRRHLSYHQRIRHWLRD